MLMKEERDGWAWLGSAVHVSDTSLKGGTAGWPMAALLACLLVLGAFFAAPCAVAGQGGLTPDDKEGAMVHQSPPPPVVTPGTAPSNSVGEAERARLRALYEILAEPETAEHMADYAKNLYDELQKRGFSGPDALRLTANMPLPQFQP